MSRRNPYLPSTMGPKTAGIPGKPAVQTTRPSGLPGDWQKQWGSYYEQHKNDNALPPDPYLDALKDSGQKQIGLADATATYETGRLQSDYGFDASGGIDPNNPYSRAALLQDSYHKAQRGNSTSYAAQGHLYAGSLQNAQDESTRQYNVGYDQLSKNYMDALTGVKLGQAGTYANVIGGVDAGAWAALLKAINPGAS